MPIPSRVLASGNSGLATTSICGDGATGLTATGSTINAGASSLSVTATTRVLFIATSATTWICIAGA